MRFLRKCVKISLFPRERREQEESRAKGRGIRGRGRGLAIMNDDEGERLVKNGRGENQDQYVV